MKSCPYVTGNSFLAMGGESIEFYYIHINGVIRIVESQEILETLRPTYISGRYCSAQSLESGPRAAH